MAGCGGSPHASASPPPTVVNATCTSSAGAAQSCTYVLGDGERFSCGQSFRGAAPTAEELAHSGCRRLASLELSAPQRALIARLDGARSCLTAKGLRAVGGPVLPTGPPGGTVQLPGPSSATQPGGELVISSTGPTFIAFYADAAQAARVEPALVHADAGAHVQVEGHGAETIVWSQAPTSDVRNMVEACLPR